MRPVAPAELLALTPGDLRSTGRGLAGVLGVGPWLDAVRRALAAGLRAVLVREPDLQDGELAQLLERTAELVNAVDGWLGVHDRAHLVAACGAQGLHLGFRSLSPREARLVVGPDVTIGFSSHLDEDPDCCAGADYRSLSPVYETPSKRGLLEPIGLQALAAECARSELPIWALGGITPERLPAVRGASARGVLVRGALLGAADPGAAVTAFLAAGEPQV
ncbi:MAG: thiamine-phosphate pyrophosphorylase [Planctomycetota bacterium]